MIHCMIIDDEASARKLLREYVEETIELNLIGTASDGPEAVEKINELKPELIFLDVQMPGFNGFEVLDRISHVPQVIFSTAFDDYAIRAFEVHAIDYLLKPYTRSRFEKAISRLDQPGQRDKQIEFLEQRLESQKPYPERFLVEKGDQIISVPAGEVVKIEAYGDYAKLCTDQDQYLTKYNLGKVEEKLDPQRFIRVHRSTIIQLSCLLSLKKYGKGFQAQLSDGSEVKVSRSYADRIKELIY